MTATMPEPPRMTAPSVPEMIAAVRAGCQRDAILRALDCRATRPQCAGAKCECPVSETIWTALRSAIPREPPAAVVDAMARAIFLAMTKDSAWKGFDCSSTWETGTSDKAKEIWRQIALAGYRALPIYRELWPDEARPEGEGCRPHIR